MTDLFGREVVPASRIPVRATSSARLTHGTFGRRGFGSFKSAALGRIFGEQVDRAVGHGWLDAVSTDLEAQGYTFGAAVLGAHGAGAPHIRPRLWFVADAGGEGLPERAALVGSPRAPEAPHAWREFERVHGEGAWARWDAESEVRVFAYGIPGVGGQLRALGNAIVPQVAAEFIGAYLDVAADAVVRRAGAKV